MLINKGRIQKEIMIMKIAVTYDNGQIFQHFGHTKQFKLYTAENGKILSEEIIDSSGSGHGALAGLLSSLGADALICGGIGGGAQAALKEAGILIYGGVQGDADKAAASLAAGTLEYDPNAECGHHGGHGEHSCGGHENGHSCGSGGEHSCQGHSCHNS